MFPKVCYIAISGCYVSLADDQLSEIKSKNGTGTEKTYGVIVDCGSSGSRAHIYQWDSWLRYPELLNNIEPLRDSNNEPITKKIHPGLSSLMYNPDQAFQYLRPIIDFVSEVIPEESHKVTSIYVLATAGMRLLDAETQLEIMKDLVEDFKSEDSFASFKTSVISGSSEGMYQWITVNSKTKRFFVGKDKRINSSTSTYGLVEMGGASIQVTYQLKPELEEKISLRLADNPQALETFKSQIVEPKISREDKEFNYKLVSTTFLGFGGNSARLAYVDLLVSSYVRQQSPQNQQKNHIIGLYTKQRPLVLKDYCIPVGSSETVTRPARILTSTSGQSVGFNIEEDDITFSLRLDGAGNYEECQKLMKEMITRAKAEKINCKNNEPCTMSLIGTSFVPFEEFQFLGLSDFYYTTREMIDQAGKYDKKKFLEKTKEICDSPYKKLLILYPDANKHDKSRVLRECFKAIWLDTFLTNGINMPDDYENFETIGKIKGDEIDWTLGAILDNSLSMEMAAEKPILERISG